MSPKFRVLVAGAGALAAVITQVVFVPALALAASGTAVISSITRDATSARVLVSGGCLATDGRQNTAQLFLRGPGPSGDVAFSGPATVDAFGNLSGSVSLPAGAAAGSTYTLSAQCTEPGQPAGPESRRIALPAPGQGYMSFDEGTLPLDPSTTSTTSTTTTPIAPKPGRDGPGATTGRATPIPRQPQFTG